MRGKLRDKRAIGQRDGVKRELVERRKPARRDARTVLWLNQETESDEYDLDLLEEDEEENKAPGKK